MKRKKLNFDIMNRSLKRSELREITAGCGSSGGGSGGCSGNWTIHPACNPYNGSSPNAIICYDGPSDLLVCNPAPGTNPQTACCG
jgi:hypothetical protein